MSREVVHNIESKEQSEGAGAKVRRSIGSSKVLIKRKITSTHINKKKLKILIYVF